MSHTTVNRATQTASSSRSSATGNKSICDNRESSQNQSLQTESSTRIEPWADWASRQPDGGEAPCRGRGLGSRSLG
jgi:hypothetical protein